jgi:hypothetical protein
VCRNIHLSPVGNDDEGGEGGGGGGGGGEGGGGVRWFFLVNICQPHVVALVLIHLTILANYCRNQDYGQKLFSLFTASAKS